MISPHGGKLVNRIVNDANIEESAVNVPNNDFIPQVPNGIVVEVPGLLNKNGVTGIKLENYPSSFGSLLNNQTGTIQLTTDAFIELLMLSKCATIVGTYASSFDELAWWMSGCKSKVIIPTPINCDKEFQDFNNLIYVKK